MPLLTISWAAGLETSVEDQNNGSYLDLAEDKEDLDFLSKGLSDTHRA